MIQSYSFCTSYIDEVPEAVADIQEQLAKVTLGAHSVGIMVCHFDFIYSGVVAALSEALPFPVIGITSFSQATPSGGGLFELTLTVMTSDDVRFAACKSRAFEGPETLGAVVREAYDGACGGERPSLILSFLPFGLINVSVDAYLREMDAASGGVAHFGAGAISEVGNTNTAENQVIFGGETLKNHFVGIFCFGEVEAKFYFGNIPEDTLLERSAVVTRSAGLIVNELDGEPATAFIEKNGLELSPETKVGLGIVPFVHKRKGEDSLIGRTMADYLEDGSGFFCGEIPEGSSFRMAASTADDLLRVVRSVMDAALAESESALLLVFSCVVRYISLGMDINSELDIVAEKVGTRANYLMSYAGGEICPTFDQGQLRNRYHNSSVVVCALR